VITRNLKKILANVGKTGRDGWTGGKLFNKNSGKVFNENLQFDSLATLFQLWRENPFLRNATQRFQKTS
jgi:uncharacterized protein (DUF2147 family)